MIFFLAQFSIQFDSIWLSSIRFDSIQFSFIFKEILTVEMTTKHNEGSILMHNKHFSSCSIKLSFKKPAYISCPLLQWAEKTITYANSKNL